jgi:hypothetical protein
MFRPTLGIVSGYVVKALVPKAVTAVAGIATSPKKMLFVAVVLTEELLIQNRTTVADDVPEAVAPLVEANRHIIWSMREPLAPAVKIKANAVPAASVPSKALVLVIAVLRIALREPELRAWAKMGVDVTAMIKILQKFEPKIYLNRQIRQLSTK